MDQRGDKEEKRVEHLTRLEGKSKQGALSAAVQCACGMAGISWQCGWTGGLAWPQMHLHFSGC